MLVLVPNKITYITETRIKSNITFLPAFPSLTLSGSHLLHTLCQGGNRLPEHKTNHDTGPPCRYAVGTGRSCPRTKSNRDVTITTHLHLLPSLTMRGATSPLPHMHLWLRPLRFSNTHFIYLFCVLFYVTLHYTFMFNPIYWIIPKKSLIQF
jgi:hypothetical protein